MSDDPRVTTESLFAFFHERVTQAREHQGTAMDEHTEFYLVNLLTEFISTCQLVESGGRRVDDLPVAIRLLEADLATPGERYRELKHLADTTLYALGWFAESLTRSTVDISYYAGLGEAAYGRLAALPMAPRRSFEDPVFRELSHKFSQVVRIIAEVRDEELASSTDVLALYEAWSHRGSQRAAERLADLGILVKGGPSRRLRILH